MKDFRLRLKFFDEGASGAAPADAGTAAQSEPEGTGTNTEAVEKKVIYGKQPEQHKRTDAGGGYPAGPEGKESTEDLDKEFDKLVRGKYKDVFTRRTQGLIDKRFAENKNLEKSYSEQSKVINLLAGRYNVSPDDPEALLKAVENDDAYWTEAAASEGMTVEQYRQLKRLESENLIFKRNEAEARRKAAADQKVALWRSQAQDCQAVYPDFDINTELQNPEFGRLLQAGVDVKGAYQAIHFDEIMQTGMRTAVNKTVGNVVNTIQSRQQRPPEAALGNTAGMVEIKSDPSTWTDEDMDEVIRRVHNGERIIL